MTELETDPGVAVNLFDDQVTVTWPDGRRWDMTRAEGRRLFCALRTFVCVRDEEETALIEQMTEAVIWRVDEALAQMRGGRK